MAHSLLALMLFQAFVLIAAMMMVTWLLSLRIGNAAVVDVAWSAFFTLLVFIYAAFGEGYAPRKVLITAMVAIWSLRLATHLCKRVKSQHPREDARYAELRKNWEPNSEYRFLAFFQLQGMVNLLLSIPFALICLNTSSEFSPLELVAVVIWMIAILGEAASDRQLSRFKEDSTNSGKTCDVGFWKYSRHPNYFFEWLVWCSFFLFALASPWGWIAIYCPIVMFLLLTRVTGIPMAEEQSLKSRGDEYRAYQQRTNAFFLWSPKTNPDQI
jgi:steroid 5-alpha reductase family enzyme